MKTQQFCPLAFLLPDPVFSVRDYVVPVAVAAVVLVVALCIRPPHKARRILIGLAVVLFVYSLADIASFFAPRMSVGFFLLFAFPTMLFAYVKDWRPKLITLVALAGMAVFTALPIDFAITFGAEKKGIHIVPFGPSIAGGFQGTYYSTGCFAPPRSLYPANNVCVFSL